MHDPHHVLAAAPIDPHDVWEGGMVQMPAFLAGSSASDEPRAPWVGVFASRTTRRAGRPGMTDTSERDTRVVIAALIDFATVALGPGHLPGRIEVNASDVAELLKSVLADRDIEIVVSDALPLFDRLVQGMIARLPQNAVPPLLTGRGVTQPMVARFFAAAAAFYQAAPWRHLSNEDLLQIEAPKPPQGMRYAVVMGEAGLQGGLNFHHGKQEVWDMREAEDPMAWVDGRKNGFWKTAFVKAVNVPAQDLLLYQGLDLPQLGDGVYPFPVRFGGATEVARPTSARLTFLTGLMRALAETTEAQIDCGRWTVGPVSESTSPESDHPLGAFTLALPDLLDPPGHVDWYHRGVTPDRRAMEKTSALMGRFMRNQSVKSMEEMNELIGKHFSGRVPDPTVAPPTTPLETAQDLFYDACEAHGRRRVQLARQALDISRDCADAWTLLAERESDPMQAITLYREAVAAGRRALGEDGFAECEGHFWGLTETRPFMRSLLALAQAFEAAGHTEEALDPYRELLRLNPSDNQGVRYLLLPLLIAFNNDREAAALLKQFGYEHSAHWSHHQALVAYRLGGDSPAARRELATAVRINPNVTRLLDTDPRPYTNADAYAPGSVEEAIFCLDEMDRALNASPGAKEWMVSRAVPACPRSYKQRKRKKR